MKVPVVIASSLICLLLGLGIGVLGMHYFGPIELPTWLGGRADLAPPDAKVDAGAGAGGGLAGMINMAKGDKGGKGNKDGAPKGPSPKIQLSTLVTKLDALTQKPLTVSLDAEQKKQVAESLKDLDSIEQLSDEDAKQRLDALCTTLKDHKDAFEATGFRWPGEPAFGGPPLGMLPNPFKMDPVKQHLHDVQERMKSATK